MQIILLILQIFSCLFLIGLILIQKGQGAEMGAAFGGSSQTVFGSRGPATFLNKMTIVVAVVFLVASLALANIAKQRSAASVVDKQKLEMTQQEGATGQAAPVEETTPLQTDQKTDVKEREKE